jgi:SAM-dependent methyltransferase
MSAFDLQPRLCTRAEMDTPRFRMVAERMREPFRYHRKLWEFGVIVDQFLKRAPFGGRALGFGVGLERLPALFAGLGSYVVATDQAEGGVWATTAQHAQSVEALRNDELCEPQKFAQRVRFQVADMRAVPSGFNEQFDFVWSSCAFEHLGSLEAGMEFMRRQWRCLRPGGWSVHTTEFNVGSNEQTLIAGNIVIFRQRDIEALIEGLRGDGAIVAEPSFDLGDDEYDRFVDEEPFKPEPHLKLKIGGYASTSCVIAAGRPE